MSFSSMFEANIVYIFNCLHFNFFSLKFSKNMRQTSHSLPFYHQFFVFFIYEFYSDSFKILPVSFSILSILNPIPRIRKPVHTRRIDLSYCSVDLSIYILFISKYWFHCNNYTQQSNSCTLMYCWTNFHPHIHKHTLNTSTFPSSVLICITWRNAYE